MGVTAFPDRIMIHRICILYITFPTSFQLWMNFEAGLLSTSLLEPRKSQGMQHDGS